MKIDEFGELLVNIVAMTRNHDQVNPMVLALKVAEETGEFATAVLYDQGYVQHKEMKEGMFEEAADVISVLLATLTNACPNMSPRQITTALLYASEQKAEKYARIIGANPEDLRVSRD